MDNSCPSSLLCGDYDSELFLLFELNNNNTDNNNNKLSKKVRIVRRAISYHYWEVSNLFAAYTAAETPSALQ